MVYSEYNMIERRRYIVMLLMRTYYIVCIYIVKL